jgi:hypothetical protein
MISNIKPQISTLVHKDKSEFCHKSLLEYINKKAKQIDVSYLPHILQIGKTFANLVHLIPFWMA